VTYSEVDDYLVPVVGMPRKVAEAVAVMRALWPLSDGPAHVVIADWNLDDGILRACISSSREGLYSSDGHSAGHPIYAATTAVLQWLLDNTTESERTEWEVYP
jgi:hypothetical protein